MTCFHPLTAYRLTTKKTEKGKSEIVFNPKELADVPYEKIELACSQCIGCRIERSKQWALRCCHEASLFKRNCFVTLTFNDEHINEKGSLVKADFQKFMKRLRKRFEGDETVSSKSGKQTRPIRYFHCGEYGSDLSRPHHHACIFNFDFRDKKLWSIRAGVKLYRSADLEELWPFGYCTVGEVTFKSAAYVARYITKKINGDQADAHYTRVDQETGEVHAVEPEYITMSRRPGIGQRWFQKYTSDVFPKDFITHEGRKFRSPKYYDDIYDKEESKGLEGVKRHRRHVAKENRENSSQERLLVREKVLKSRVKHLERGIENDP